MRVEVQADVEDRMRFKSDGVSLPRVAQMLCPECDPGPRSVPGFVEQVHTSRGTMDPRVRRVLDGGLRSPVSLG